MKMNQGNGFLYGRAITDDLLVQLLKSEFDDRELRLILNCLTYAENDPAGLPGHGLMLLVAKLLRVMQLDASLVEAATLVEDEDYCYDTCDCDCANCQAVSNSNVTVNVSLDTEQFDKAFAEAQKRLKMFTDAFRCC